MVHTDEMLSFEEMKKLYPEEWMVVGNPVFDGLRLLNGIVILHGKDKRELAYQGRELIKNYQRFCFWYAGEFPKNRKFLLDFFAHHKICLDFRLSEITVS